MKSVICKCTVQIQILISAPLAFWIALTRIPVNPVPPAGEAFWTNIYTELIKALPLFPSKSYRSIPSLLFPLKLESSYVEMFP